MAEYTYKDLETVLLAEFEDLAHTLCKQNERETGRYEFTSQQMLKKAAQRNQDEYVQWLMRCREHFPEYIFSKAHEDFGRAISVRARNAGFEQHKEGMTETNIFGDLAERVTYKPTE